MFLYARAAMTATSSAGTARRDDTGHRRAANRAVAVSAAGLALTGAIELAIALVTGSVALLGDAIHNLSDVSTSAVVFLGFWVSRKAATRAYPYGYERAEDLAGLGVALVIWASAAFAGYQSFEKLVHHTPTTSIGLGMAAAVLGMIGNQAVSAYKRRIGRRISSLTLLADARHSWLDAIASLGALTGLALVAAGLPWGDPVAGFAITLFICHVGYEVTSEIVHHLMDGVEPEHLAAAEHAATAVDGVHAAIARGRWTGRTLLLDIEAHLDPGLVLADAGHLTRHIDEAVQLAVPAAGQVHSHAHPGRSSR
ncbi:MAG TPA: cation transporter [Actinobacteria bacterium]|nr:cation transporter [Actinomycetota bacterium]